MIDRESKELPQPPDAFPESGDSGKETTAQRGTSRRRRPPGQSDPTAALHRDALVAFRILKREHRALFDESPKEFRRQVRKAQSQVLSLKRGPKPDPVVASAAREVAAGVRVENAFEARYPGRKEKSEDLYAMALESFRTKVNAYIRRHLRLKRLRDRRKIRRNCARPDMSAQPARPKVDE